MYIVTHISLCHKISIKNHLDLRRCLEECLDRCLDFDDERCLDRDVDRCLDLDRLDLDRCLE